MKHVHHMPFGAEPLADGRVCFQLWAPAAERVDLCLQVGTTGLGVRTGCDRGPTLPMVSEPGGWFRLVTDEATTGMRYLFRIDGGILVPDPASRFQSEDVHGPSEVVDAGAWPWRDADWRGRPWEEAVIYELHVGAFTAQGTFTAVQEKLRYLTELGVTAIELMPIADFPGKRNWGYDGVYPFAPDSQYGRPEDLKALVDAAHRCGLMVFLDVVYNHFGAEGNYLHAYAPQFFTEDHTTPWGTAINYDGECSDQVRQFFIHNALYWLEEYRFDGLRLDAVHAIVDDSEPDILTALAQRVHESLGGSRHIHLVLENDHNAAHYLTRHAAARPSWYTAQWNDDIHHALHVLLTRESSSYYMDYSDDPVRHLGRCLTEGFAYQGERSAYRNARPRGESSSHLPATAFVSFLQNHDQVGNRAFGERISTLARPEQVRAALVLLLLAPSPPLLFMGEEWGCTQPFAFFCDFGPDLAARVVAGRLEELAHLPEFSDPAAHERVPNPMDPKTFEQARLDWGSCSLPEHEHRLKLCRELLSLRRRALVPRLHRIAGLHTTFTRLSERALSASWLLGDGSELLLIANLGSEAFTGIELPLDRALYATHAGALDAGRTDQLPPWSVIWYLRSKSTAA